jgi:hypothetical protein
VSIYFVCVLICVFVCSFVYVSIIFVFLFVCLLVCLFVISIHADILAHSSIANQLNLTLLCAHRRTECLRLLALHLQDVQATPSVNSV